MCGRRTENAYVIDMAQACELMMLWGGRVSDTELMDDHEPYRDAVLHQLVILGEAAKNMSQATRDRWTEIPWNEISRMRDRLVHYYHRVDDAMVIGTIRTSIPALLPQLRAMLAEMDPERTGA